MRDFTTLAVWHRSREVTAQIYEITRTFPPSERYNLVAQLRRAAASVSANIAEGQGRGTDGEVERYLRVAAGSAAEIKSLVATARDVGFIPPEHLQLDSDIDEVRKMLHSFIAKVRRDRDANGQPGASG